VSQVFVRIFSNHN